MFSARNCSGVPSGNVAWAIWRGRQKKETSMSSPHQRQNKVRERESKICKAHLFGRIAVCLRADSSVEIQSLVFKLHCFSWTRFNSQDLYIFSHFTSSHILHPLTSSHTFDTYALSLSLSLHISHIYITTVSDHLSSRI